MSSASCSPRTKNTGISRSSARLIVSLTFQVVSELGCPTRADHGPSPTTTIERAPVALISFASNWRQRETDSRDGFLALAHLTMAVLRTDLMG